MDCSTPGLFVPHHLLEFAQTHAHWISDATQPSHPLSPLLLLPSVFPSITIFSNESALSIRWPNYWSFSFSISPFNDYSGFISFRIDLFDLLAVQVTLKSLLQHHILAASVLLHSVFFMVQPSHPYITTGKSIALTMWIFARKVMSLLFKMLPRFVVAFSPGSKCLLILRLHSTSVVILELRRKSVTVSIVSPSICIEIDANHTVGNLISGTSAFPKPSCTSGSSWFTDFWNLA